MIKIEKVVIPAQEERIEERKVFYCDICNKSSYGGMRTCHLCGRTVCHDHQTYDPEEMGDYPDCYCIPCSSLKFHKYLKERQKMEERHFEEEEKLMDLIKKESLETKNELAK